MDVEHVKNDNPLGQFSFEKIFVLEGYVVRVI